MYDLIEDYDQFYPARGKDYAAEAARAVGFIRDRKPDANSLLDIACGTGAHLRHFANAFDEVAGLELSGEMLEIARKKLDVPLHQADMRDFSLDQRFDAATCMFSSIGHMADVTELTAALTCIARHVVPGGVIFVEPWWFPGTFLDGHVAGDVVEVDGRTISRVSHSRRAGRFTKMEVHWVVAESATGPKHAVEHHEITLFEQQEYEAAFVAAGCKVEYHDEGPGERGKFVAVRS